MRSRNPPSRVELPQCPTDPDSECRLQATSELVQLEISNEVTVKEENNRLLRLECYPVSKVQKHEIE